MTARSRAAWCAVAAGACLLLFHGPTRTSLADLARWVDRVWLHERMMDTLARWHGDEDWSLPPALRAGQDYRWTQGPRPLRIAHALGESGQPTANTIGAMRRAYAAGLRVFEVDLVFDAGRLRCQHDPGPRTDVGRTPDECTLDRLLEALPADAWVMLDLKTDFEQAGEAALEVGRRAGRLDRLIFQLYAPAQVRTFAAWQGAAPQLPGPVLTTYLAHRSLDHIVTQAHRLGILAVTLPMARLPALPKDRQGALVLLHPVHDCDDAAKAGDDGRYTLHALNCSRPASPSERHR